MRPAPALLALVCLGAGCLLDVEFNKVGVAGFCEEPSATPPTPESCKGSSAKCGPDGEPCCTSTVVPCGTYLRDVDHQEFDTETNRAASLADFRLDKFEVTVGRFRQFLEAGAATQDNPEPFEKGAGAHPKYLNSGWDPERDTDELAADAAALRTALDCTGDARSTWTDAPGDNETRPQNCVTWYEALLFCAWDGGRLPSEAEWGYAAAGGELQREYPWEVPAHDYDEDHAVYGCPDAMVACPVGTSIASAGSKPAGEGRFGQYDMAGNVSEWVLDAIADAASYTTPCEDCVRIGAGARGIRGGAFNTLPEEENDLRVSVRKGAAAEMRTAAIGFRCVRSIH